jgi:hypothetical protein
MNLLNVHINENGIVAAIANMKEKRVEGLLHYDFPKGFDWNNADKIFGDFYQQNKNNFYNIDRTMVFWHNELFSVIPSSFYKENFSKSYLEIHHSNLPEGIYNYDAIRSIHTGLVYVFPEKLKFGINQYFTNNSIMHGATSFIQNITAMPNPLMHTEVFISIHGKYFEVIVRKGFELVLYNQFLYELPEDILYHTLNIYEQFKLDKEKVRLTIAGNIAKQSPIVDLLEQYIGNIEMAVRPNQFAYSEIIENLPAHFYFNLFQSFLCV